MWNKLKVYSFYMRRYCVIHLRVLKVKHPRTFSPETPDFNLQISKQYIHFIHLLAQSFSVRAFKEQGACACVCYACVLGYDPNANIIQAKDLAKRVQAIRTFGYLISVFMHDLLLLHLFWFGKYFFILKNVLTRTVSVAKQLFYCHFGW